MKIAHIADLHCCREHAEEALASLRFFAKHIKKLPVKLVTISGDVWDASMLNTEASGFNRFTDAISDIANLAPVAMIYGTPSHDTDGSLEVFRKLNTTYGITVLEPGQAYFLHGNGKIANETENYVSAQGATAVLFGIPEPRKKYLLAGTTAGKDETEEAVREAMHRLCFHLAAKRREYADIPCIVLYHGEVAGTVYQNDQTIERGTGISITVDDLADIGADYYALGHIHKPQQVGNLPAYYAGSIYPKNFGETHKAGFNVVVLDSPKKPVVIDAKGENEPMFQRAVVIRHDFPHPQNLKIERVWESDDLFSEQKCMYADEVGGKRVWLEFACEKSDHAQVNQDGWLAALMELGAAEGSRVTVRDIPVETVRAAEITSVSTPMKKFEVWAQNSDVAVSESLIKKIEALAAEITQGAAKAEGEWELVSLRLKGAIGIMKGIKKEEVAVNFDSFARGLIALTGANGKGKTTLIENGHPYPRLLTRKGKLQDHFFLKDSFREIIYRNRADGSMRKFLIQIDGQNKSGSCKYFIFCDRGSGWEAQAGIDGNLKPYEDALASLFGPVELYQRTAHSAQKATKNLPDLTDATAGEKKALFVELAGIDYLQRFSESALTYFKAAQERGYEAKIKAAILEQEVTKKPTIKARIQTFRESLAASAKELDETTEAGKLAKAEVEWIEVVAQQEREREFRERTLRESIAEQERGIESDRLLLEQYEGIVQNRSGYEKQSYLWDRYAAVISAETEQRQQVLEKNLQKQREFLCKQQNYQQLVRKAEQEKQRVMDSQRKLEKMIQAEEAEIRLHARDAGDFDRNCPTCGQELPETKLRELTEKRRQALTAIETRQEEIARCQIDMTVQNKNLKEITETLAVMAFDEPQPDKEEPFDDTALREAQVAQEKINIAEVRDALVKASEAAVRIEQLYAAIKVNCQSLEAKRIELAAAVAMANPTLIREFEVARERHEELTRSYIAILETIARQEAELKAQEERLREIETKEGELAVLRETQVAAMAEGMDWDLLVRSFGRDGIQALELDALAPGISETANRILESAYGDRFRIEIRTTRIGGVGKKTKQIEDFLIYVTDSEDGEPVLLENKSGGEAVWIKRAIYDAFAVIRRRNTNFAFLTCFQDEADGALDSAAKTAYCRMLEAAHAESGLRHMVIITHSNEVKAMIEQKIDMDGLASSFVIGA